MGKGERGVVAREMGMEERRGEQEKGVEGGEEGGEQGGEQGHRWL